MSMYNSNSTYYWLLWLLFHCGSYISDHLNTSLSETLFWQELKQSKIHPMFNTLGATKCFHCVPYVEELKKVVEFILITFRYILKRPRLCKVLKFASDTIFSQECLKASSAPFYGFCFILTHHNNKICLLETKHCTIYILTLGTPSLIFFLAIFIKACPWATFTEIFLKHTPQSIKQYYTNACKHLQYY